MPFIQTKPKEAGLPVEAIQFNGDPSCHPNIRWHSEACKPIDNDRWCLYDTTFTEFGQFSEALSIGDWIVGIHSKCPEVIYPGDFVRDWQLVKED